MRKLIANEDIQSIIYKIRGVDVMLDSDLARIYGVETKVFNQAVKRNIIRFPDNFRFQLNNEETFNLRSHFVTSSIHGGRRYLPFVFTEQGVSMLSTVLKSQNAIQISISIMNAFVEMRKFLSYNANIFQRLEKVEFKQLEAENLFHQLFKAIEEKGIPPKNGIFFNGEIFDAYLFVSNIIRSAKDSIILIDNYIDDTVLSMLDKRASDVSVNIFTHKISKQLELDILKYNSQYPEIKVSILNEVHDRFLIIDHQKMYHFGASFKDLGKKWVAFSEMNTLCNHILLKLNL
jgi:hypothetical protein